MEEKNGRYPSIRDQKRILVQEYGGILLEDIKTPFVKDVPRQTIEEPELSQVKDVANSSEIYIARKNRATRKYFVEFDEGLLINPDGRDIEFDAQRFRVAEEVPEAILTEAQVHAYRSKVKRRVAEKVRNEEKASLQRMLFSELRKERKRIADKARVPAYIVFDDKTLMEMAEVMPESQTMMREIRGVGQYKAQKYGEAFIKVIANFKSKVVAKNKKDIA